MKHISEIFKELDQALANKADDEVVRVSMDSETGKVAVSVCSTEKEKKEDE